MVPAVHEVLDKVRELHREYMNKFNMPRLPISPSEFVKDFGLVPPENRSRLLYLLELEDHVSLLKIFELIN